MWHHSFDYHRLALRRSFSVLPPRPLTLITKHISPVENLSYWHRPHTSTEGVPILFLHGIGIGLWTYGGFLAQLKHCLGNREVGILAIEYMPISFRVSHAALDQDVLCGEILRIVQHHMWEKFVLVCHSYGSVVSTHLLKNAIIEPMIQSIVLIDPVSVLLHLPDVAYNFTCRSPVHANEHQLYYFASMDMGVAHTLHRRFFWQENILWKHEIEHRQATVVLCGRDIIVNTQAVGRYLIGSDTWPPPEAGSKDQEWKGEGLEVLYFNNLDRKYP